MLVVGAAVSGHRRLLASDYLGPHSFQTEHPAVSTGRSFSEVAFNFLVLALLYTLKNYLGSPPPARELLSVRVIVVDTVLKI